MCTGGEDAIENLRFGRTSHDDLNLKEEVGYVIARRLLWSLNRHSIDDCPFRSTRAADEAQ